MEEAARCWCPSAPRASTQLPRLIFKSFGNVGGCCYGVTFPNGCRHRARAGDGVSQRHEETGA